MVATARLLAICNVSKLPTCPKRFQVSFVFAEISKNTEGAIQAFPDFLIRPLMNNRFIDIEKLRVAN